MLTIDQVGTVVLRRPAETVPAEQLSSPEVQRLIDDMIDTMSGVGVGLAAPQVGVPLRIAVIEDRKEYQRHSPKWLAEAQQRRPVDLHVVVNPVLSVTDPTPMEFFEGCLSVEGYRAMVPRASGVHLSALDRNGRPIELDASGWYARILQHEIDHLGGVLYVDRMVSRTFITTESYADAWLDEPLDATRAAFGLSPNPS